MLLPRLGNSRWKMREERWKRKHVIPPSLIRRGMESLTVYSECRDAIHRMINHPLWHDAPVTPVLLLDISLLFPLSTFISHLEFPNLGRSIGGRELRRKFPLRNGDFLIASKMPKASVLGNLLLRSRQWFTERFWRHPFGGKRWLKRMFKSVRRPVLI